MHHGFTTLQQAGLLGDLDYASFRRHADLTGMQRHLKAAGISPVSIIAMASQVISRIFPVLWGMWWMSVGSMEPASLCFARFGDWLQQVVLPGLAQVAEERA